MIDAYRRTIAFSESPIFSQSLQIIVFIAHSGLQFGPHIFNIVAVMGVTIASFIRQTGPCVNNCMHRHHYVYVHSRAYYLHREEINTRNLESYQPARLVT